MKPLINDMMKQDPSERPTMDEVVERFQAIRTGLSRWKLRSRIRPDHEPFFLRVIRSVTHNARHILYSLRGFPSLPTHHSMMNASSH